MIRKEKQKKKEMAKKASTVSNRSNSSGDGIVIVDDDSDSSVDENAQPNQKQEKNYLQMAQMGYQQLINAIIRPPRANYEVRKPFCYLSG